MELWLSQVTDSRRGEIVHKLVALPSGITADPTPEALELIEARREVVVIEGHGRLQKAHEHQVIWHCHLHIRPIVRIWIEFTGALPDLALLVEHPDAMLLAVFRHSITEVDDCLVFLALQI